MSKLICFLADISGSMGTASTNADEGKEYSRLDFVKQSMIFAINAIQPDTLFALVTFESQLKPFQFLILPGLDRSFWFRLKPGRILPTRLQSKPKAFI